MIAKIEQRVTVTLQLNEDKWLKGIVQNPLNDGEETKNRHLHAPRTVVGIGGN